MPSLFALPFANTTYGQATPQQILALQQMAQMPKPVYKPLPPIQWGTPINVTTPPSAPVMPVQPQPLPQTTLPTVPNWFTAADRAAFGLPPTAVQAPQTVSIPANKFGWNQPNPMANMAPPPTVTMPNFAAKTPVSVAKTK